MKVCNTCRIEKTEEDFYLWKSGGTERRPSCKVCVNDRAKNWHKNNRDRANKRSKRNREIRNEKARTYIIEFLKKNPCKDCGIENLMVLEFDHVRDKECGIAQMLQQSTTVDKIKKEIAKCEVVCANCHRIRTYTRNQSYKYIAENDK